LTVYGELAVEFSVEVRIVGEEELGIQWNLEGVG